MNDISLSNSQLPDTIEDLSKFVLVNEERIQALRAQIRAIKKVNVAKEVYEQKLAEAQEIGQITVEAAQKMGELLLQIQKGSGHYSKSENQPPLKNTITAEMGMTRNQVSQYQQMAQNPEAVQTAIQKAIENGDVVSRSQVMKEIRAIKDQVAERDRKIAELESRSSTTIVKEVVPDDYEAQKRQARAFERDYRNEQKKVAEKQKEILQLKDEIEELKGATKEGLDTENLSQNVFYFCTLANNFIGNVGGLVWLTDRIADMPDRERDMFLKAAYSFRDWAQAFSQNLERSMYDKRNDESFGGRGISLLADKE